MQIQAAAPQNTAPPLPDLRDELQLIASAPDQSGKTTWLIFDPVRYRYFQIGHHAFQILSALKQGTVERLQKHLTERERKTSENDINELIKFLFVNQLTREPAEGGASALYAQTRATHRSWASKVTHSYLFFKIPLLKPDAFLTSTYPYIKTFFCPQTRIIVMIMTLLGLYLTAQQWDAFLATALQFFSWQGAALFSATLFFIKVLHELGHAYSAKQYGCRVPTMGVAFMVMLPMLYTDVTDAWRLKNKWHRLAIDTAGIRVELALAGIATFAWTFLSDGPARSAAFFIATSSWILSLLVNLNPFMRFDGYHILADSLDIKNLQPRSFALARWSMRKTLFGLQDPPPEHWPKARARFLIGYAYATWIYRFFLFLGIALLVYHMAFKALGIALFVIEIIVFIAMPFYNEIKEWAHRKTQIIKQPRAWITATIVISLSVLFITPLPIRIALPALLQAQNQATLITPSATTLNTIKVQRGNTVTKGQVLISLKAPDIDHQIKASRLRLAILDKHLSRQTADKATRSLLQVYQKERMAEQIKSENLMKLQSDLTLQAPISGTVTFLEEGVQKGAHLAENAPLITLINKQQSEIRAYIAQEDLSRITQSAQGVFIPENPALEKLKVTLATIAQSGETHLKIPYFFTKYGGKVAVEETKHGQSKPLHALYEATFTLQKEPKDKSKAIRGTIHIDAVAESYAARAGRQIAKVLLRETGF